MGAPARVAVLLALAPALAAPAAAGPALFQASLILHAFGNDVTSGTTPPYTAAEWTALPLGRNCQTTQPGVNGYPNPFYCSPAVLQAGHPASGPRPSGPNLLSASGSSPGARIDLPQSALGVTVVGLLPVVYPTYLQSQTYATFVNAAGTFFADGGPAAGGGQKVHIGMGQKRGTWIIQEGARGFGGIMGLLGKFGAKAEYRITGMAGIYVGTNSWNMIRALGRLPYATPTAYTPNGKASNWVNPHKAYNYYTNTLNGNTSRFAVLGTGTPWTTGSVTLLAAAGGYETILHRAGHDTLTPSGARNLQLVTPALTHWIGLGFESHTGHIGILALRVPEPSQVVMLAAGLAALALLHRLRARR